MVVDGKGQPAAQVRPPGVRSRLGEDGGRALGVREETTDGGAKVDGTVRWMREDGSEDGGRGGRDGAGTAAMS